MELTLAVFTTGDPASMASHTWTKAFAAVPNARLQHLSDPDWWAAYDANVRTERANVKIVSSTEYHHDFGYAFNLKGPYVIEREMDARRLLIAARGWEAYSFADDKMNKLAELAIEEIGDRYVEHMEYQTGIWQRLFQAILYEADWRCWNPLIIAICNKHYPDAHYAESLAHAFTIANKDANGPVQVPIGYPSERLNLGDKPPQVKAHSGSKT